MKELKYPTTTKFVVCTNEVDVFHFVEVDSETVVTSGQPYMHIYATAEHMAQHYGDRMSDEDKERFGLITTID